MKLSYITSRGEEIVLDNYDGERSIWELWGRMGFAAPPVEYVDEQYADGYTETLAVRIPPRDVTLNLAIRGFTMSGRDQILHRIINKMEEHGVKREWGRLKVSRSDGREVYLNCFYSGGVESLSETEPFVHLLSINFHAPDPYFYDFTPTKFYFADTEQIGLYFGDEFIFGSRTYFMGGAMSSETIVKNQGQVTYPEITVVGPAKNIKLQNQLNGAEIALEDGFQLFVGETMVIDCRDRKRSITLIKDSVRSDITNKLRLGSSLVFPLATGDNNIKITYTDTTAITSVTFAFQQRWLSA